MNIKIFGGLWKRKTICKAKTTPKDVVMMENERKKQEKKHLECVQIVEKKHFEGRGQGEAKRGQER